MIFTVTNKTTFFHSRFSNATMQLVAKLITFLGLSTPLTTTSTC
jgi:hypothetical protein